MLTIQRKVVLVTDLGLFQVEAQDSVENTFSISYALLDRCVQQGFVFLTPKQVMKILGKTWGQVRYAIYNYELDCYLTCGEYRITVQALEDYISGEQERFEAAYHDVMLQRELSGVHALAFEGRTGDAYRSLMQHGYPVSALDDLLLKTTQRTYDDMPSGTTEAFDFYGISSLPIPDSMYLYELADMLQVSSMALCEDMDVDDYTTLLDYPSIYDYLVVEQFLNANIPVQLKASHKIAKDDGQLSLF